MRLNSVICFLFLLTLIPSRVHGQEVLEQTVRLPYQQTSLRNALERIEQQTGVNFSYNGALIPDEEMITLSSKDKPLGLLLDEIFLERGIQYKLLGDNLVLYEQSFEDRKFFTITGYIRDAKTLEGLPGAHIYNRDFLGTSSNEEGFFSIRLPPDSTAVLFFSYLGYQTQRLELNVLRNQRLNINLQPSLDLNVVTVLGLSDGELDSLQKNDPDFYNPSEFYERQSTIGGEYDPIKALQLLPGTQSGNEGTAGLYVRGSAPDQNLVLYDGIPIYYPNHLFGLFSIFNGGMVRKVELIKGPFPARYSGRLSSILSVTSKDAHLKELRGQINLGLIASNLLVEIPIVENRTGLIIGGRQSYMDFYLQPLSRRIKEQNGEIGSLAYQFRDINFKVQHHFSEKEKLELVFYSGLDRYQDAGENNYQLSNPVTSISNVEMRWKNRAMGLKYSKEFPNKLHGQFHLWQSVYDFNFEDFSEVVEFFDTGQPLVNQALLDYQSMVNDIGFNADFDYYVSSSDQVRFGFSYINHRFQPGANAIFEFDQNLNSVIDTTFNDQILNAQEIGMYLENEVRFNSRTSATVGLHIGSFLSEGELFTSLQPRLSLRYLSHPKVIFGASFSLMTQYLHLLTNSSLGLPTDLWIPTTEDIAPQKSSQGTLSMNYTPGKGWDLTVEGFYKNLDNQLTYLNESRFLLSSENL
ncbi:MAG: TonB-dependent receptor [Bacteroidota bacterium]